jgi:hypothetical protein
VCGIAGYICFDGRYRPTLDEIKKLHILNESRGPDASGVGFLDEESGDFALIKANLKASEFYELAQVKRFLSRMPRHLIMHTRAPTQGNPENPLNNHPIPLDSWLVVHNGQIRNDVGLLNHFQVERIGEVDSFGLVAALAKSASVVEGASLVLGSFAVAAVRKDPFKIHLFRDDDRPLSILVDLKRKIMFWSSDINHLIEAFPESDSTFNWQGFLLRKTSVWRYWTTPKNVIYTIDYDGLQQFDTFKTDLVKAPSSYQTVHRSAPEIRVLNQYDIWKQKRDARSSPRSKQFVPRTNQVFDRVGKVTSIICPVTECAANTSAKWLAINDFVCPGCRTPLFLSNG